MGAWAVVSWSEDGVRSWLALPAGATGCAAGLVAGARSRRNGVAAGDAGGGDSVRGGAGVVLPEPFPTE